MAAIGQALWWLVTHSAQLLWWLSVNAWQIALANYGKRHRDKLREPENVIRLLISVFIMYIIAWSLLETDRRLGFSFIVAGITAIWFGYVYRGREVMGLVLVGVIVGTLVTLLAPSAWKAFSSGDIAGAVIILALISFFYYISSQYKKGKHPKL